MPHETLTPDQLTQYFNHINLPPSNRTITPSQAQSCPSEALPFLQRLLRHHMTTLTWENLSQHFNPSPVPTTGLTSAPKVLSRAVNSGAGTIGSRKGGRGGVCFEQNVLLAAVLRSLGFKLWSAGARVASARGFGSWTHVVNIVVIAGRKFMVDVGFGGRGPVAPLELVPDGTAVRGNIEPAQARLVLTVLPGSENGEGALWMYQWRADGGSEWVDKYAFAETEFFAVDFDAIAVLIAFRRDATFYNKLLMNRQVMAEEIGAKGVGEDEIVGEISLVNNKLRRYIHGKEENTEVYETEDERQHALKKWFGIELSSEEVRGIKGTVAGI